MVNFDKSGTRHEEHVSVRNGGQLVTISDTEDGFSVILDYEDVRIILFSVQLGSETILKPQPFVSLSVRFSLSIPILIHKVFFTNEYNYNFF